MKEVTKIKPTAADRMDDCWPDLVLTLQQKIDQIKMDQIDMALPTDPGNKILYVAGRHDDQRHKLWDVFMSKLPEDARQHYNCNACRHFIVRYGYLVVMDRNGHTTSALWDPKKVPGFFYDAVLAMKDYVEKLPVGNVFIHDSNIRLGVYTGCDPYEGWTHFNVVIPWSYRQYSVHGDKNEIMNSKKADFECLRSDIERYPYEVVCKAFDILSSGQIYRAEVILNLCKWFKAMHEYLLDVTDPIIKNNLIWRTVAENKTSQNMHVNSSLLGTVLKDIQDGKSFNVIKARLEEKTDAANYMRAKSGPTVAEVEKAEEIVAKLGAENSMKRRLATMEDIIKYIADDHTDVIWDHIWYNANAQDTFESAEPKRNTKEEKKTTGVFGSVTPVNKKPLRETVAAPDIDVPPVTMTYDVFSRKILPDVESMSIKKDMSRFVGIVAPADENAPNILRWNNKFSWFYPSGSDSSIKDRVLRDGGNYDKNILRCSLIWNGPTDLDLHCFFNPALGDPYSRTMMGRNHIFFQNKQAGGGFLDVDANGGRVTSYEPVENIIFRDHINMRNGKLIFKVHDYEHRDYKPVPYTVEVAANGIMKQFPGEMNNTSDQATAFVLVIKDGKVDKILDGNENELKGSASIQAKDWYPVIGIMKSPNTWGDKKVGDEHRFFICEGLENPNPDTAKMFFSEMLTEEFREVRKTIESFIQNTPVESCPEGTSPLCGFGYYMNKPWGATLRCKMKDGTTKVITIDRAE